MPAVLGFNMHRFFLIACLIAGSLSASADETIPYQFKIQKKDYRFSTFFEIDSEDTYRGTVKKSCLRVRTHYDLSNQHGWQATGICRLLTLGALYTWATEIDVYDTEGTWIGMIDGQVMTTAAARFSLYNEASELVGIAFLDQGCQGVTIASPDNEAYTIAKFDRLYVLDKVDDWIVSVYDPGRIDGRLIRIFAAFILDHQGEFKADH